MFLSFDGGMETKQESGKVFSMIFQKTETEEKEVATHLFFRLKHCHHR